MSELQYHLAILDWLRVVLPAGHITFHVPNGERRDAGTAAKLQRMGTMAGVPDLVIVSPGGRVAFLEIKRPKGRPSPEQRAFRLWCTEHGVPYAVCVTIEDARAFVASLQIRTREAR